MRFCILLFGVSCAPMQKENLFLEEDVETTEDVDADLDGYLASEDCDDAAPEINPGAVEVCDERDNNCDGNIDEDVLTRFYIDEDGDGYGDSQREELACEAPVGHVLSGNDCDDSDESIFPGAAEICDERDNNCDGNTDEELGSLWHKDEDGDGYGDNDVLVQACTAPEGFIERGEDCDDSDDAIFPGASEICDGIDNNCNEAVDENGTLQWYLDADGDGYGDIAQPTSSCTAPVGYVENALDCDDNNAETHPGATEICDFIDNDCNGTSDDNAEGASLWYVDADLDGFGSDSNTASSCTQPIGYANNADDCDDSRFESSPIALEYCNGVDDDCDGDLDENDAVDATIFFLDGDEDGYGDPYHPTTLCSIQTGYASNNQDCNDGESAIYPYATEYCNAIDDNCNMVVDEAAIDQQIFYEDLDEDGYGSHVFELACNPSSGYISQDGDCDDDNVSANPGATEICNEIDDDCDGSVDEALPTSLWYADADSDGYGDPDNTTYNCLQPTGYLSQEGDCNDADSAIHPGSIETCNGLDDDCDGSSDAGALGGDAICVADSCLDILTENPTSPDGLYFVSFDTGIEEAECDMGSFGGGWTRVFADDMSPPDTGWTMQTTSICGIWGEILGGYGVISGGSFENDISTRSIPHSELWVEMDYITLDSWDDTNSRWGPDMAFVQFNNAYIWHTDIDNHLSIYGQVCGWWRPNYPQGSYDSRHYVSTIESGSFPTFNLTVGSTLSQGP
ncbi:MAG: putative metal-binding motif-containing protein, partial [Myxococcota bacterium]|nr:putative metal-binding motif-containing protein [Myxococcota bacterium]